MAILKFALLLLCLIAPCYCAKNDRENLAPFLVIYNNGTIERDTFTKVVPGMQYVTPQDPDPQTGVSSKDIIISSNTGLIARIYLPKPSNSTNMLPILLYFHGGGFCIGSAFYSSDQIYLNKVSSQGNVIVVTVEYRMFPEHTIPAPYEDAWTALNWVAFQRTQGEEPWLVDHGDFDRVFIGGESAGANIAHNLVMRVGKDGTPNGINVIGMFLGMPYFLGSTPVGNEPSDFNTQPLYKIWKYVCPTCKLGVDDPRMNPFSPGAPSVASLGCKRIMVYIGENDVALRERDYWYVNGIKASGWKGELEVHVGKGDHVFHVMLSDGPETKLLIERLAVFLQKF